LNLKLRELKVGRVVGNTDASPRFLLLIE